MVSDPPVFSPVQAGQNSTIPTRVPVDTSAVPIAFGGHQVSWASLLEKYVDTVHDDATPPFLLLPHIRPLIEQAATIERARLYELLFITGGRISEVMALTKASFFLDHTPDNHISLPTLKQRGRRKATAKRKIKIDSAFALRLKQWLGSLHRRRDDKIFTISPRTVQRWLERERQAHGLHVAISPHTFRHSCAVHLALLGYDAAYIQKYLGHSDLSSTQVYLTIGLDLLQAARPVPNFQL